MENCRFCYQDGKPPQCAVISLGLQTYLALPNVQELVPGHCMIVPVQHVTSTLELDDDAWDEIRVSLFVIPMRLYIGLTACEHPL